MDMQRLEKQLQFIEELDRVKQVMRNTLLLDRSRLENDAEHSWHAIVAAIILSEYANEPDLDLARVMMMIAVHDVVEIDAGDTFAYDELAHADKEEREERAADRIFGLLPAEQSQAMRQLWDEFEGQSTPESRFAGAMDSFMPLLHNYLTEGEQWRRHGVSSDRVLNRNQARIARGSKQLAAYVCRLIDDAVERGYLSK